jgi:hypothetical protein
MALACALGGLFVGSCIELIQLAGTAYTTDRCPTLLKRDKAAIGGTVAGPVTISSAPLVGVGRSAGCTKHDAEHGDGDNSDNRSSKHGALQDTRDLVL